MNRDELKGKADQLKGKAKQAVGDLTDDEQLRNEGQADEIAGRCPGRLRQGAAEGRRDDRGDRREAEGLRLELRTQNSRPRPRSPIPTV